MRNWALGLILAVAACGNGGGGGGDMGALGGNDLAGAPMVALSGTLTSSGGNNTPLAGATMQIMGASPAIMTTSAADGSWTMMVPEGATVFVGASATGFKSGETGVVVPTGGTTGVSFNLVPNANFDQVVMGLSPMLNQDPAKGLVAVNFRDTNKPGGYGASISANHGMAFTIVDSSGTPAYGSTTVAGSNVIIFPNTDAGTTTVTVTPPSGKTCAPPPGITSFRVDPGFFNFIDFHCT